MCGAPPTNLELSALLSLVARAVRALVRLLVGGARMEAPPLEEPGAVGQRPRVTPRRPPPQPAFHAELLPGTAPLTEALGNEELASVLGLLVAPEDLAAAACAGRALRDATYAAPAWQRHCAERFCIASPAQVPTGHAGAEPVTHCEAFRAWSDAFADVPPQELSRALRAWRSLESSLASALPGAAASLAEGASAADVDHAESLIGKPLPASLRAILRVHNGQDLDFDRRVMLDDGGHRTEPDESMFHGMFGGYSFYNHVVNVRMLSLESAMTWTQNLRQYRIVHPRDQLVFAISFNLNKIFVVELATGSIRVLGKDRRWMPAAPPDPSPGDNDGVLRWLEEYASRLSRGVYAVEKVEGFEYLSIFASEGTQSSVAVTRGVQVEARSLFVPEQSTPSDDFFTYSIRFSLLGEEEQRAAWPATAGPPRFLREVQLRSRHWLIADNTGHAEEVRGEAVVGAYPILHSGETPFVYQSCTGVHGTPGSMEGDFAFVEGTLAEPQSADFDVLCAPFTLERPVFIY